MDLTASLQCIQRQLYPNTYGLSLLQPSKHEVHPQWILEPRQASAQHQSVGPRFMLIFFVWQNYLKSLTPIASPQATDRFIVGARQLPAQNSWLLWHSIIVNRRSDAKSSTVNVATTVGLREDAYITLLLPRARPGRWQKTAGLACEPCVLSGCCDSPCNYSRPRPRPRLQWCETTPHCWTGSALQTPRRPCPHHPCPHPDHPRCPPCCCVQSFLQYCRSQTGLRIHRSNLTNDGHIQLTHFIITLFIVGLSLTDTVYI